MAKVHGNGNGNGIVNEYAGHQVLDIGIENPSLQVTADHNIKMVSAPVYKPGPGEALLHIKATGICGYVFDIMLSWITWVD